MDVKKALDSKQFHGRPLPWWSHDYPSRCTEKATGVLLKCSAPNLYHDCKCKPASDEILPHSSLLTLGDSPESKNTCFP